MKYKHTHTQVQAQNTNTNTQLKHKFLPPSALVNLFRRLVAGWLEESVMQTIHNCSSINNGRKNDDSSRVLTHMLLSLVMHCCHLRKSLPLRGQYLTNGPVQPLGFDMMYRCGNRVKKRVTCKRKYLVTNNCGGGGG